MFLPSKFVTTEQALLTLGGQVLESMEESSSVSDSWASLKGWRAERGIDAPVPFWWFALAIDCLFMMGAIELDGDRLRRSARAARPQ